MADERVLKLVEDDGLPVVGVAQRERADAARNRRRILDVAARMFEEHGADNVSMDQVAEAAGVGKGTLYRRFGDRCGLAREILDERERLFQESLIRGKPPLGPGAPPRERLIAFAAGVMGQLDDHGDIILAAETGAVPGARFRSSVYACYRLHVRALLRELDATIDDEYFADVLLAALSAEMVNYWRSDTGIDRERMADGFARMIDALAR
jgi:AcrR family transcriptional regulator